MTPPASIPRLDFARADTDLDGLARDLDTAMRSWGAFLASGLPLDPRVAARQLAACKSFHALPADDKAALWVDGRLRRYQVSRYDAPDGRALPRCNVLNAALGFPEARLVGTFAEGPNRWPAGHPEVRLAAEAYDRAMLEVSAGVTRVVERALGVERGLLQRCLEPPTRQLRLMEYPPCGDLPPLDPGMHADPGYLTFIIEDGPRGLLLEDAGGQLVVSDPRPGEVVVQAGILLSQWTNGRWCASRHGVRQPREGIRYSCPWFLEPAWDATIACLPTCQSESDPARFPPTTYGEMYLRFFAHYGTTESNVTDSL